MTDRAPHVRIVPVRPLCSKGVGPRGDSLVMQSEDRTDLFHDDGSLNDDDRHHYEAGGGRAPIGHAEEAWKSSASSALKSSRRSGKFARRPSSAPHGEAQELGRRVTAHIAGSSATLLGLSGVLKVVLCAVPGLTPRLQVVLALRSNTIPDRTLTHRR